MLALRNFNRAHPTFFPQIHTLWVAMTIALMLFLPNPFEISNIFHRPQVKGIGTNSDRADPSPTGEQATIVPTNTDGAPVLALNEQDLRIVDYYWEANTSSVVSSENTSEIEAAISGENISLQWLVANLGSTDLNDVNFYLQYATKQTDQKCDQITTWNTITEHSDLALNSNITIPSSKATHWQQAYCKNQNCTIDELIINNKNSSTNLTANDYLNINYNLDTQNTKYGETYCLRLQAHDASLYPFDIINEKNAQVSFANKPFSEFEHHLEALTTPEVIAAQDSFTASESPHFELDYFNKTEIGTVESPEYINSNYKVEYDKYTIQAKVHDLSGQEVTTITPEITLLSNGYTYIDLSGPEVIKPGKYTLEVKVAEQDFGEFTLVKEFSWGVFAFNTDKDIYMPGDSVDLMMTVLDPQGTTVCDATIDLLVQSPSGVVRSFTTHNGSIILSDECAGANFTYKPDFLGIYQDTAESGKYLANIKVNTEYGEQYYSESFDVEAEPPFIISRKAATRIYPVETYTNELTVYSRAGFTGALEERVPASWEVNQEYTLDGNYKVLTWHVEIASDSTVTLRYESDAPDISPEFYIIGAALLKNNDTIIYKENRNWQVASDAVGAAFATRLWTNGFERNTTTAEQEYTANIGTTGSISTSTVRSGTYALRTNLGASGTSGIRYDFATADSATGTVVRAYIRVATLPSTQIPVLAFRDASTYQASLRIDSSGNLLLWDEEDNVQVGSTLTSAISVNTWYRLEIRYDFGTTTVGDTDIAGAIDGNIFASTTTANHVNGARSIDLGILSSATGDFYWDDLAINTDAFAGHDNWIGEGKVVLLLPDGNGTNTTWTAGTGAGDYLEVDDPPSTGFDDITTYVTCSAGTEIDDYTLASSASAGISSSDRIRLVEGWSRARSSTSTSSAHTLSLTDGTNTDAGASNAIASTTWFSNDDTKPRNSSVVIYNLLGAAFHEELRPTDVDNLQIRLTTADCSPAHQVTAVWALVEYVPAEGGRVFSSGFELNSGSTTKEWDSTTGTVSIDSTTKRSGTYSLRASSLASGTEESVTYAFESANNNGAYFTRSYLYISTLPSAENRIIELQDSGNTPRAYITLSASGTLALYDEDGQIGSASSVLNTGQWYRVEMKFDSTGAGATDTIEARIDGTNFATSSTRDLTNGVVKLILGGNLNSEAQTQGDWYFDDVAINYGVGTTQNSYPGAGNIVHLHPNGNGTYTAWANDYTTIDEIDPDDLTANSITTSTLNARESAIYEDTSTVGIPGSAEIKLVSAGVRTHLSTFNTSAFTVTMVDTAGGQELESRNIIPTNTPWFTNYPSTPRAYPLTAYTRPMRNTPWTTTDLDALEVGVRETSDSNATLRIATMWALVEYVDATITISGTCDAYDQTTDCTDVGEVKFAVNGTVQAQTQPTVSGNWTISGVTAPANGAVVTVFIDGASDTDEAVAVTKYDGSGNITGIKLFKEHLTIGSDDNQTLTNADLSQYDNSVSGDEDIFFDVSAGNDLTVDSTAQSSQEELYILAGNTYQPASGGGADVNTHDLQLEGTLTADSNTLYISGSWLSNGTLNAGTSNTVFTATSGSETIDSTMAVAANFNNLTFGSGSSTATWSTLFELAVNGDLTIDYGTLDGNDNELILYGGFINNSNFTSTTSNITFLGSADVIIDTGCSNTASCTAQDFYTVVIDKDSPSNLVTLANFGLSIEESLSISQGTFVQGTYDVRINGSSSVAIGSGGSWQNISTGDLVLGGTFVNSGSVTFQGNGAACGDADDISISSTSGGAQRSWSGSGSFSMNDVSVQDQGGSASITVYSGTSVSNNDSNWTFESACPTEPTISISQGSGTIQIDVPNRYRMIMNTGDTDDFMLWYDRDEDDASPDATHEFKGPCITETNVYCLRDDAFRRTHILEANSTRVRLRVEGKFNNEAGSDYLDDESGTPLDVLVTEEYTFTIDGVFVKTVTDFRTTGVTLDADSGHNGYEWLGVWTDVTDGAFNEGATPDIIYGDGATETNSTNNSDGAELSNSNTYVVLPGTGSATYQDAIVGIVRAGWYDDNISATVHEWHWDEGNSGTQDLISTQEQNYTTFDNHTSMWFFHLLPEATLDSEIEREGYVNDIRNPDYLEFVTGSKWDDVATKSSGIYVGNSDDRITYNDTGSSALDITGSFTLEGWFKFDRLDTDFQILFTKHASATGNVNYTIDTRGGSDQNEIECGFSHSSGFALAETTNADLIIDKWYHIACVHDASADTVTVFIDGVQKDGQVTGATQTPLTGDEDLFIGDDATANWGEDFEGRFDEARIWNVARTQSQLVEYMHQPVDPASSGLVAYYRMNEGSGTVVHDETTNNFDMTFDGGVSWSSGVVPDHFNEAEKAYTLDLDTNEAEFDIDAQTNVSTTLSGASTAGASSVSVSSTAGFPSSGVAYINGDKFTYSGTSGGNTFTGIPTSGADAILTHSSDSVVASVNRYNPFFKAREFLSTTLPSISLESSGLVLGTDYQADLKPVTSSYFAQDVVFYSPLQSTTTNIGDNVTNNNCTFVNAKYGYGVDCDALGDYVTFTTTNNIDYSKGVIEFWMQPKSASTDNTRRQYFYLNSGSDYFQFAKTIGNDLEFAIHDGTTESLESIDTLDYSWEAYDWVHIRLEWDETASAADAQKIFINGQLLTHTDGNTSWIGANVSPGSTFNLGNQDPASYPCNCIIDEFYIYDTNSSGDRNEVRKLAEGGDSGDSDEYLYDASNDYSFDFNDDDGSNRGEYIYLGSDNRFQGVNSTLATAGVGSSLDFDWEYWDGTEWSALTVSEVDSGAAQFTASGSFYFAAPGNWVPYALQGGPESYYIRGHLEGGSYSTDPVEDIITTDILLFHYKNIITSNDQTFVIAESSNTAPGSPTSLAQLQTDDTVIPVAGWTDETSVKFSASASDTDNPDTLQLCIEVDQLGTGFSNVEDSCGSGVTYSGSPVTVTHTIAGLSPGTQYHWQARIKDASGAYSSWVSFSTNAENERDFGVDNTAPGTGTVYDGNEIGVDADYNDGSLTSILANWTGITDAESGLSKYQYAIGTTSGATDILGWTDVSESGNIFNDSFETGDLSSWDTSVTNSGNLEVTNSEAYLGQYSLQPNIVDTNDMYVEDSFSNQSSFSGRFYINVEGLTPVSSAVYELARITDSVGNLRGIIYLQYSGGNLQVQGRIYPGPQATSYVNLNLTGWNVVEYNWEASASSQLSLWVNGTEYTTAAVDSSGFVVARHRVGMSSVDSGTSGYILIDSIASSANERVFAAEYVDHTVAASGHLHTGQNYYVSVRGVNNSGLTGSSSSSDGLQVMPTLSFGVSSSSINFLNLNSGNSYTDTKTTVLTTSTNAYNGYIIYLWTSQLMTHNFTPSYTIPNYSGTNTTPTTWGGTGFGYTTTDAVLSGGTADRFTNGGPKYAGFLLNGPGDPVADHTASITGTTGAVVNQQFTVTYRITTDASQAAGPYSTNVIFIAVPIF